MSTTLKLAIAVGLIALSSAGIATASAQELKAVASFSIIADFAKNVGGDRVEVTTLVGPGGDAHVYQPKPADAVAVAGADVVLVNGLQFEGFLARLVEASGTTAPIVELTAGCEVLGSADEGQHGEAEGGDHADTADDDHGASDPHAWHSVHNAEVYVGNIAQAFCTADPAGCDTYQANAESYIGQLTALDTEIRAMVAEIPAEKRTIITSHDAFGYLEHEYGITFLAPEGMSTESEASAADIAALIEQARVDGASAIFVENITNPRLMEQVAAETGLSIGGELYSDALSDGSGPAATYLDMMRHNVSTIKAAILGS